MSPAGSEPSMLMPESEEALAEIVRSADGPLAICGGGTRGMAPLGTPLCTRALSGVTLHEPGALTLVARSGTPVSEIEGLLAGEGQRLPFEPMDHRSLLGTKGQPTLGGVIAGNISGPRRIQCGAARDFALGVRFVDGCGAVVKNGGRVMKNVTGYDLVKLMCGSWGTLGVLSEISLKVLPVPEAEATLQIPAQTPNDAVADMSRAFSSPFDVSGAGYSEGFVQLRLEGFGDSVRYRTEALRAHLGRDANLLDGESSSDLWRKIRDVTRFSHRAAVWKISVKPTDAPGLLEGAGVLDKANYQLDWAGGLVWIGLSEADLSAAGGLRSLHLRIQEHCAKAGGHATLVKARGDSLAGISRFQPEASAVATLSDGIRARFDPRGLFNPGLMSPAMAEVV